MDYIIISLSIVILIELTYLVLRSHGSALRSKHRPVYVDTSVLMDGRILQIARTGFISERLVIPRSVVAELQLLADAADSDKRVKARHGLDVVNELQQLQNITVEILADGAIGDGGVDTRLLELAKKHGGYVCTIDFNLNKVAQVEGIFVLNPNELAQSVRMAFLPGEKISLAVIQKGNDAHQGVGYLADGTMVVVEQGAKHIGQTVQIEFIRSLQTAAGRMMFAKLAGVQAKRQPRSTGRKTTTSRTTKTAAKSPKARSPRQTHEDNLINLVNNQ